MQAINCGASQLGSKLMKLTTGELAGINVSAKKFMYTRPELAETLREREQAWEDGAAFIAGFMEAFALADPAHDAGGYKMQHALAIKSTSQWKHWTACKGCSLQCLSLSTPAHASLIS